MNLDVLIFAAHPDDAELAMGGTISKLMKNNLKAGIIDLTRGELGTRGNADIRRKEAVRAAGVMGISIRENLQIPDGGVEVTVENERKIVIAIRKYRPKFIFAPYFNDRHPDHVNTSKLVKRAMFTSGLSKFKTSEQEISQNPFRPAKLYYYMQTYTFEPSFIVDISDVFEIKMKAVNSYSTQFYNPKSNEPETFISSPQFISNIEARAKFYGFQIGKEYGEPFYSEEKVELDLVWLLKSRK